MIWLLIPVLGVIWFSWRYAWWRPTISTRVPRILMYHMVAPHRPGARFNGLRVTPKRFEQQLAWLVGNGWTSLTLSELLKCGEAIPEKAVVLTFDDGFADNLHRALPLLEKYNCKATLYLVVDRQDREWSTAKKAHHDSGELKNEGKLSDEEVRQMLRSGRVELASHTLTHPNFLNLGDEEKLVELTESKHLLEEKFDVSVESFAYPFGYYRSGDDKLVQQAGYSSAVTTESGLNDFSGCSRFLLKRVKISGKDNLLAFILRMRGGRRGWKK
jgi:peptidoglycan/xylan/chitin deacetylase (PgdA/CDA1 family)